MLWIYQRVCWFSGNISQASGFRGSLAWQVLGRGGACNGACPPPPEIERPRTSRAAETKKKGGLASVQRTQTWALSMWLL